MEIKDYLHFYIGQKFVMRVTQGEHKGQLTQVMDFGLDALQVALLPDSHTDHIKPLLILRRLSDMTEEEKKEFRKLIPHIDFVRFEPKGNKWVYIEHEPTGKHETRALCTTTAMIGSVPMSAMPYLLKQGFDLFGLIDAGLAIDRVTL